MFLVQPRRGGERDEKLAAIGVRPRVCHAQDPGASIPESGEMGRGRWGKDLVVEFGSVDEGPTAAGAGGVAALEHKVWDNPVEEHAIVVASPGECFKVFASLQDGVRW